MTQSCLIYQQMKERETYYLAKMEQYKRLDKDTVHAFRRLKRLNLYYGFVIDLRAAFFDAYHEEVVKKLN